MSNPNFKAQADLLKGQSPNDKFVMRDNLAELVKVVMRKRPADRRLYSIMVGDKVYSAAEIEHDLYEHPDFPHDLLFRAKS